MDRKIIDNIANAWQEVVSEKKKLDPVGKADADIDNDGDVDSSDSYLHNRRKAIKKAMKKEEKCSTCGMMDCKCKHESADLDADNVEKALRHDCATHVASEQWGFGECISGQHTLEEQEDGTAIVTHYDVMFEHGIEMDVPVEDLEILVSEAHLHASKKKMKKEDDDPCWDSHKMVGMKNKGGKQVPNCVPKESVEEGTVAEFEEEVKDTYSMLFAQAIEKMRKGWGEAFGVPKQAKHVAKPEEGEGLLDKESPKGKQWKDDQTSKEDDGREAQSHLDATQAGRVVNKQSPARGPADKLGNGEKKIINPVKGAVTSTTGKEGA